MANDISTIVINFPEKVRVDNKYFHAIVDAVGKICNEYQGMHPGRVMWPFGIGFQITRMPMTPEDEQERGIEFDENTLAIDCSEREDYNWPCKKCSFTQGDHKSCIANPKAGDCDFEPLTPKAQ